jgi:phage N-6-adenine-methyltransferase
MKTRTRVCALPSCRERFAVAGTGRPREFCKPSHRQAAWRHKARRNPRRNSVHFSSATDEWATPRALFDKLDAEHGFTLDVCATRENAKCERHFTRADDGLAHEWDGIVWCNPPYGRSIGLWVRKAYESAQAGATVVMLVPARTDTRWWHEYCARGEVTFLPGRVKFGDGTTPAPFPSAVVVFRPPNSEPLETEPR